MAASRGVAQNALAVETPALGMTGWRTDPPAVDTPVLGMTGWRADPFVVSTPVLGMTGWRTDGPKVSALSGTLDLRDLDGSACPRQAEVALSLRTNAAGPVSYRLDCTGDRSWSQTATAHKTGPNTYIAVAVLPFSVEHKEQVNCALKSHSPKKVLALRGRAYACTRGAGSDLVGGPKSEPPRVVADPPRPACVGGSVAKTGARPIRYACRCPSGQTPQATGPNSYRCQGRTTVAISCAGGTVGSGQCVCPSNMRRVQAGANAWHCVRAAQPVRPNIAKQRPPPQGRRR